MNAKPRTLPEGLERKIDEHESAVGSNDFYYSVEEAQRTRTALVTAILEYDEQQVKEAREGGKE